MELTKKQKRILIKNITIFLIKMLLGISLVNITIFSIKMLLGISLAYIDIVLVLLVF